MKTMSSEIEKAAEQYRRIDLDMEGVFCRHCNQRVGDAKGHFLAGAKHVLEVARKRASKIHESQYWSVYMHDLEELFEEEK